MVTSYRISQYKFNFLAWKMGIGKDALYANMFDDGWNIGFSATDGCWLGGKALRTDVSAGPLPGD
jgi:hypothetical protein